MSTPLFQSPSMRRKGGASLCSSRSRLSRCSTVILFLYLTRILVLSRLRLLFQAERSVRGQGCDAITQDCRRWLLPQQNDLIIDGSSQTNATNSMLPLGDFNHG